jgi:hypothetical protein
VALLAGDPGREERGDDLGGDLDADDPAAETQNVDRVVLDALVGGVRVVDRRLRL